MCLTVDQHAATQPWIKSDRLSWSVFEYARICNLSWAEPFAHTKQRGVNGHRPHRRRPRCSLVPCPSCGVFLALCFWERGWQGLRVPLHPLLPSRLDHKYEGRGFMPCVWRCACRLASALLFCFWCCVCGTDVPAVGGVGTLFAVFVVADCNALAMMCVGGG
ncbi:trans-sialidase [Trypanosoma cruzi]|nr:trans-sialidase [Trypanosoma cruzi]